MLPLADSPGDTVTSATDPTTLAHVARSFKVTSLIAVTCLPAEHIPATAWHGVLLSGKAAAGDPERSCFANGSVCNLRFG